MRLSPIVDCGDVFDFCQNSHWTVEDRSVKDESKIHYRGRNWSSDRA